MESVGGAVDHCLALLDWCVGHDESASLFKNLNVHLVAEFRRQFVPGKVDVDEIEGGDFNFVES